ncbi:MAG: hypothetical protein V4584_14315 [Verrucomicrobiota bacterium]
MKFHDFSIRLPLLAFALVAMPLASHADTFEFSDEDLLLGVQAVGGTGSTQNLFIRLGNTVTIKNSPNQGVVANIAADLSATYGANWFEREDLFFGIFGNRSNLSPATDPGTGGQDPGRTVYLSSQTTVAGASAARVSMGSSSLGTGTTKYAGLRGVLTQADSTNPDDEFSASPSGATILNQASQPVSWNNSWSRWNPTPGAAFDVFTGGVQNNFGKIGVTEVLVDVQRLVPSTPGTYVTTVGIGSNGAIRLFTASQNTPFQTWTLTFPALDTTAKRLPTADPDNDGLTNLMEFVLNGNPGVRDPAIVPGLNAAGDDFVFSFNRRDDSEAGSTLLFQYGSDLSGWTNVTISAAGGTVGSASVVVGENALAADAVSVTVPKTVAPSGRLFGRLRVTQP